MPRHLHPYFGQLNRNAEARTPLPGAPKANLPLTPPVEQTGVLWDLFRSDNGEAATD